jgi:hypothetical protein
MVLRGIFPRTFRRQRGATPARLVQRQRHADHPGGGDEHLFRIAAEVRGHLAHDLLHRLAPAISARPTTVTSSRSTRSLRQINALEPQIQALSTTRNCKGPDRQVPPAAGRAGQDARRSPARSLRHRARGIQARAGHAPFRRADDRRHRAPPRRDRRNAHRRGQDPGGDAGGLSQRIEGKGVHVVTVNDYLARRDANGWASSIAGSA